VNSNLRRSFASLEIDLEQVRKVLEEARSGGISLDGTTLEYTLRQTIERLFGRFSANPGDLALLQRLDAIVDMARTLPFEIVLWTPQNVWSEVRRGVYEDRRQRADAGDEESRSWVQLFTSLGGKLKVCVGGAATVSARNG
jgi:hypothetical protein